MFLLRGSQRLRWRDDLDGSLDTLISVILLKKVGYLTILSLFFKCQNFHYLNFQVVLNLGDIVEAMLDRLQITYNSNDVLSHIYHMPYHMR